MILDRKRNDIIRWMILPVRLTSFISLLWWIFNGDVLSDPSVAFFYSFFLIYLSSFAIEVVLTSQNGFIASAKSLSPKYAQMLPVEFAVAGGFGLLTFAPHTADMMWLALKVALVGIVCAVGIEAYHKFIPPRLNRKKITPQVATLAVIGMTVTTFFEGFYYLVLSAHHLVFIQ